MMIQRTDWFRQDILLRHVTFDIDIIAETALRIGMGRGTDPASPSDLPVVKVRVHHGNTMREVAYIPGSSLKGFIRSVCEFIARSCGIYVCYTLGDRSCSRINNSINQKMFDEALREDRYEDCLNVLKNNVCIICRMFGSTLSASLVDVDDALPVAETPLRMRVCVAIDRNTGAAARGALYNYEYVEPGTVFRTRISCLNLPNYALGLLVEAMRCVNMGLFKLGGFKSRGLGRVRFDITKLEIVEPRGFKICRTELTKGQTVQQEVVLKPLDETDQEVRASSLEELLDKLVESWYQYVSKARKASG